MRRVGETATRIATCYFAFNIATIEWVDQRIRIQLAHSTRVESCLGPALSSRLYTREPRDGSLCTDFAALNAGFQAYRESWQFWRLRRSSRPNGYQGLIRIQETAQEGYSGPTRGNTRGRGVGELHLMFALG